MPDELLCSLFHFSWGTLTSSDEVGASSKLEWSSTTDSLQIRSCISVNKILCFSFNCSVVVCTFSSLSSWAVFFFHLFLGFNKCLILSSSVSSMSESVPCLHLVLVTPLTLPFVFKPSHHSQFCFLDVWPNHWQIIWVANANHTVSATSKSLDTIPPQHLPRMLAYYTRSGLVTCYYLYIPNTNL